MYLEKINKEKITKDIYSIQYYIWLREDHRFNEYYNLWKKEIWRYIFTNSNGLCQYRQRNLRLTLYRNDPDQKLTASILRYNTPIVEITIWSKNINLQQKIKADFKNWDSINNFYGDILRKIKMYEAEQAFTQCKSKKTTKKTNKFKQKNPNRPAARIRKARRHLERLGFSLHKSKNKVPTSTDFGLFQVCNSETKAVVYGKNFDVSLNDIENFYKQTEGTI